VTILVLSNLYPPDFIGGYELACAHVVDSLQARGHDVQVLTAQPRHAVAPAPGVHRRFKLIDEWNPQVALKSTPMAKSLDEIESRYVNSFNVHVLTTALEEFRPDVVYVCNIVGIGGLGLMACLQYIGVPWVWQLGDNVPNILCSKQYQVRPRLAEEFARLIEGHFIVVSQQLRNEIEAAGIRLNGRVELLPYWITGARPPSRTSYYQGGHLRIMSAGQVARHKGIDILIESASKLRESGFDDFSVDIYGKDTEHCFSYLIRKLGMERHVTMMGMRPQSEVLGLYGGYDVFAFPTWAREPFGMVPLEAAARGCVPVISRSCGIAEWLVHGVHCLKAERTADSFARVFADIIRDKIMLEPLARRAEILAWRDFHIDAVLPRIERLLVEAARKPRGRAGTPAGAYQMARMAEQLAQALVQEAAA
jgi:glycosyltransferase involved in cell wall biosynthesis